MKSTAHYIPRFYLLVVSLVFFLQACGFVKNVKTGLEMMQAPSAGDESGSLPPQARVEHGSISSLPERIEFYPDNTLSASSFVRWVQQELGVSIRKITSTASGQDQQRVLFQQSHRGFPVEGSAYILHMDKGKATYANGLLFDNITVSTSATTTPEQSEKLVIQRYPSSRILESAGPIILARPSQPKNEFYFCYKHRVYSDKYGALNWVFVDINEKEIVEVEPLIYTLGEPGRGYTSEGQLVQFNTQYIDGQSTDYESLTVESVQAGYRLFDTVRNLHTVTHHNRSYQDVYDFTASTDGTVKQTKRDLVLLDSDIISEDNTWLDHPAAVDIHWGATKTYDYFLDRFGRQGYNNDNGYLKMVVNFGNNLIAAHYNYYNDVLVFSDGANNNNPLSELDIVAHEFSHAVTHSYARLKFWQESGSIDEALSDIFATAVKFKLGRGDWLIAKSVRPQGLRNLADPKSLQHPDTYEGDHWSQYPTQFALDIGLKYRSIRHEHGEIMNYWFYLLCEGGKGENDNEDEYEIQPIGMEKATEVVYASYNDLFPTVNFHQLRGITIAKARQLYGKCSDEVEQITNAWFAVGVGEPYCQCFEGSLIYHTMHDGEESKAKMYFKEDKTAIEAVTSNGSTIVRYTSDYDRRWHLKGKPDMVAGPESPFIVRQFINSIHSKNVILKKQPLRFQTWKEYTEYRNRHRTGRSKEVSGYVAYEYVLEGRRFWSTDEACLTISDIARHLAVISPSANTNLGKIFFGLPVEVEGTTKVWITDIEEHPVDDSMFSG